MSPPAATSSGIEEERGVKNPYPTATTNNSPTPEPSLKEWKTWKLRWYWMTTLLLTEATIIVTIITLTIKSIRHDGFASAPQASKSTVSSRIPLSSLWQYGLLWTTLPSFIMTLYGIMWATIVSSTAEREPFIELRRSGRTVKTTIMLDYRSYPTFYNWIIAFRNRHQLLGLAMLLSLFLTLAVVPLSSHLFVTADSQSNSPVFINYETAFNESALTSRSSLQPAIDLATSIRVHGANAPPWMTIEYAFEAFDLLYDITSGNLTAEVNAYSSYLDCQTFSPSESNASYAGPSDGGFLTIQIKDRDCEISQKFPLANNTLEYAVSWNAPCTGSTYGRNGIFAGIYSDNSSIKIANYSLISCVPSYWITTGSVTIATQPNRSPQFISFVQNNVSQIHPVLYSMLEDTLHSYTFFDPTNSFRTDAFGYSVYSYAQVQDPASPMTPDLIKSATEEMWTTLYAGIGIEQLLQPLSALQSAQGELSVPVTRVYVVTPVAYTILVILILVLTCNISLFIYAEKNNSILVEQPTGLIGIAGILDRSDVSKFTFDFRREHPDERKMIDFLKKNYNLEGSKCYFDDNTRRIRLESLLPKRSGHR